MRPPDRSVTSTDFAPVSTLLIASGRRALGAGSSPTPAIAGDVDWGALPNAAQRHGMTAWVNACIPAWHAVPPPVREAIAQHARAQHVRALDAVSQLSTLSALLHDGGIETVSLKGPLFSRWLYGDMGMRRFADLDLLVRPAQRDHALDVLRAAGYELPSGMSVATARTIYAGTGAWPLSHPAKIAVDLHWQLQATGFGRPLDTESVMREHAGVALGGRPLPLPVATHTATLTLLHATKHLWASLEVVLAIAALTQRTDVEWDRVYQLNTRAGTWTGSAAGLALAEKIFEVDLPRELRGRIVPAAVRPLVDAALGFLAMPDVAGAPLGAEMRAHRAALDGVVARARYAAWRLLAPTPLEAAWCRLPGRLGALYVPVRLIRLALRHRVSQ